MTAPLSPLEQIRRAAVDSQRAALETEIVANADRYDELERELTENRHALRELLERGRALHVNVRKMAALARIGESRAYEMLRGIVRVHTGAGRKPERRETP